MNKVTYYLVQTRPNCEEYARSFLVSDRFEVYFPRVQVRHVHAGRISQVIRPLFARYVFIKNDGERGPFYFRCAPGISVVVRSGNQPILVGQSVIDQLKEREDRNGYVKLELAQESIFRNGDIVRVKKPHSSFNAIFSRKLGKDRAEIFVNLLGRDTKTTVQYQDLVRV